MSKLLLDWPPPYTIKKSAKSKCISLRISPQKGLEIIIPKRESQKKALEFLNLKYDWIQKHRHLLTPQPKTNTLPQSIHLKALNEIWTVNYEQMPIKNVLQSDESHQSLLILGNKPDEFIIQLKDWLRHKAETHLLQHLKAISLKHNLPYNDAHVRYQQTRWGSCSKNKNINLNCRLLLIPESLVRYVIVHELIHTIHFDHSRHFWTAVERIVPNYKELRTELKNIEQSLPNWVYY